MYEHRCKKCGTKRVIDGYRSLKGKVVNMYRSAVNRCKKDKYYIDRSVSFTICEFKDFVKTTNYKEIHGAWVKSGYKMKLSPSIDRIDNARGYDLDNIQIITVSENARKHDG